MKWMNELKTGEEMIQGFHINLIIVIILKNDFLKMVFKNSIIFEIDYSGIEINVEEINTIGIELIFLFF